MSISDARRQDSVISRLISVLILGCLSAAVVAFGGFSVVTAGIAKVVFFLCVFFVAVLALFLVARRRTERYRR
jgi:uncharacterized membrane protein YtjA (UPF0391 family)